jgi:hypothetical protein
MTVYQELDFDDDEYFKDPIDQGQILMMNNKVTHCLRNRHG